MILSFEAFELDLDGFELRAAGVARHVEPLVFDLLRYFAERPGAVLGRDELVDGVWRGRAVSDATISSCIKSARRALGGDGERQSLIQTVRGRGFRFAAQVTRPEGASPAAPGPARIVRDKPVLAIMPFRDLGGGDDRFADGVVEEITAALSCARDFHVIARQSTAAEGLAGLPLPQVAARLGATYMLEGSVRRSAGRARIAVQLVEGEGARVVGAFRFDDDIDELFSLQDRIAEQVAGELAPRLRHAEIARARARPPAERSAYDLAMTAYPHFWAHRRESNAQAIALFDAALKRAPDYPLALAMKGWALAQHAAYNWSDDPARDRADAVAAAERAEALADDHVQTLVAIGAVVTMTSTEQGRARCILDRALALDPNNAWGWMRMGWVDLHCERFMDALADFDHADRLSPLDPFRFNGLFGRAICHELLGDLDQAVALAEEGLATGPGVTWAYRLLARFHAKRGDAAAAAAALAKLRAAYPHLTIALMRRSMPPAVLNASHDHFADLRAAGLPES